MFKSLQDGVPLRSWVYSTLNQVLPHENGECRHRLRRCLLTSCRNTARWAFSAVAFRRFLVFLTVIQPAGCFNLVHATRTTSTRYPHSRTKGYVCARKHVFATTSSWMRALLVPDQPVKIWWSEGALQPVQGSLEALLPDAVHKMVGSTLHSLTLYPQNAAAALTRSQDGQ